MAIHAAFRTNLYKGLLRNVRPKTSAAVWVRILTALKTVHENVREYHPVLDNVNTAFTWQDTAQGHEFWSAVHRLHIGNFNQAQKANIEGVIMGRRERVDDDLDELEFFHLPGDPIRPEPVRVVPAPRVRVMKEEAPLVVF